MKIILTALLTLGLTLTAHPAEAKSRTCKVVSSTIIDEAPGGVQYYPDGTSETLTKYTVRQVTRCKGHGRPTTTTRTFSYIGY